MNHDTQLELPFDHEPFYCEEDYLNYLEAKAEEAYFAFLDSLED